MTSCDWGYNHTLLRSKSWHNILTFIPTHMGAWYKCCVMSVRKGEAGHSFDKSTQARAHMLPTREIRRVLYLLINLVLRLPQHAYVCVYVTELHWTVAWGKGRKRSLTWSTLVGYRASTQPGDLLATPPIP